MLLKRSLAGVATVTLFALMTPSAAQAAPEFYPPTTPEGKHYYEQYAAADARWLDCEWRYHDAAIERDYFESLAHNQALEIKGLDQTVRELDELWTENQATIHRQTNTINKLRLKIRALRFQLNHS